MLGVWCWYILGYCMYLIEKVMYVYFVGMTEGGEVWVGALCMKVCAVSRGRGCVWLAVRALFNLCCYRCCCLWCVFAVVLVMDFIA